MPSFRIVVKKKNGDVVVNNIYHSFPSKKLAENWAKEIARLNDASVKNVIEVKSR